MRHLEPFDDWLKYQQLDGQMPEEAAASLRAAYEHVKKAAETHDVTAVVRRPPRPAEYRYAVAIEGDGELWLTLWVKCSPNGEYFISTRAVAVHGIRTPATIVTAGTTRRAMG